MVSRSDIVRFSGVKAWLEKVCLMKSWFRIFSLTLLIVSSQQGLADFTIADTPLFLNQAVNPRVMLTMSNDHQLYIKAYTDYSDLDGDGVLDTTYADTVNYAGYFDSNRCYRYNTNKFIPKQPANGSNKHNCSATDRWSGNFLNWATMTRMDIIRKVLYGGYRSTDTTSKTILERTMIPFDAHAFAKVFTTNTGADMKKFTPYDNKTEITLCNLTEASGLSRDVNTTSNPPLMRAAEGLWPHWASDNNRQCNWGNGTAKPRSTKQIGGADYQVRVKVCAANKEESHCTSYPDSTVKKPEGILQHYGSANNSRPIQFGLMTGSYQKNKSGGVLRRNISALAGNSTASMNEFDSLTGIFINQGATDAGIINTLNRLRISSYNFSTANNPWGDRANFYVNNCSAPGIGNFNDGECVDWGNPLSEIYLESLRYFAGKPSATSVFNANDAAFISGLPQVPWTDPMPSDEWCADNSIITISTGLNSYDTDQLSNDLSINVNNKTNEVGTLEGISGSYLIGSNGSTNDELCTAKPLANLSDAMGICPEVPQLQGGYGIAGLAYFAHTEDIRSDRNDVQNINTSSIALAESLPRFEIPMPNGRMINILPACRSLGTGEDPLPASTAGWHTCTLMNVVVKSLDYNGVQELIKGSLEIDWEDSTQGYDFDMDATHLLEFCVGSACTPAINNDQIKITNSIRQAAVGFILHLGFTVTGSDNDGVHLPLELPIDAFIDESELASGFFSLPWEPSNVRPIPASQSVLVSSGTTTARLLENPLWYAAKYGGFTESDDTQNNIPDQTSEWDADANGIPDTYYSVTNPAKLEDALEDVLNNVVSRISSASSVATNSTRLDTTTLIYQARFNSGTWEGQVLAYPINTNGSIAAYSWDAGDLIPTANSRKIYTYDSTTSAGIEFKWSTLNATQKTDLNSSQDLVNYLRGDQSNEVENNGSYRDRTGLLGDIVNSDPWFIGHENYGYENLNDQTVAASEGPAYRTFIDSAAFKDRREMLYVGANDGMLHGFDATTGVEQFAYIPSFLIADLPELASTNYAHRYYVDGSPRAADVNIGTTSTANWKTVLVGSAGAGGRGIFALDVTNPDTFTTSSVMWEFDSSDDSDLGYTQPQPTIVRMANGKWAAIVANGYNSDSHKAILFILDITDGSVIAKLDTGAGDANTPNGLSTAIPVDTDNDYTVDVIYAGDMLGNLWKFDVSDTRTSKWESAFNGHGNNGVPEPMFIACNEDPCVTTQPITSKPQVGSHPDGGVMVYFGTGQYFETGDNVIPADPQVHTYYGIRDNGVQVDGRDDLQVQTIDTETTSNGNTYRITSDTTVDFSNKEGWYLDLVPPSPGSALGERVVAPSLIRNDRIIFTTLIPSPDPCGFGGTSWLMELDAVNGARLDTSPIDINNSNTVNNEDVIYTTDSNSDGTIDSDDDGSSVSGVQSTIGIFKTPGVISSGDREFKYLSGSSGDIEAITESNNGVNGRLSWRELR